MPIKRHWSGMTLIELMIALTLGILISGVAIQLHVNYRKTYNFQRVLSLMQEQGRYAQELLTSHMKLSGYAGQQGVVNAFKFSLNSDGEPYDVLEIQFAEAGTDCMGGPLREKAGVIRKRFYVKDSVLLCADSDGIRAPIIQDVDRFQIVYGVDLDKNSFTDSGFGSADIYLDGKALSAIDNPSIVSVKIALVIRSDGKVQIANVPEGNEKVWLLNQYVDDEFTSVQKEEQLLRRVFLSTTAIRNFSSI